MKKILHLFRTEKFTESFVNLMKCSKYDHTFWIFGEAYLSECTSYLKARNVKYYPRIEIKLNKSTTEKQLESFDLIVYHGVFEDNIIEFFCKRKILLKKLALYFWGGDRQKKVAERNFQRRSLIRSYLISNSAAIITIIPQDYEKIKKDYHPRGKYFCARYFDEVIAESCENKQSNSDKNGRPIRIQIGNSATDTNCHLQVLNQLKKYKENNIELYLPLSYGNMKYAEQVISYGKEIFGDKLKPITEFMPLEKYNLLMGNMDVAIFAMTRQQAMGNIYVLMLSGCKIYLNLKGMLWKFFTEEMQCTVTAIDEISSMTFEQFVAYSEEEKRRNREEIQWNYSRDKAIKQWEEIFAAF